MEPFHLVSFQSGILAMIRMASPWFELELEKEDPEEEYDEKEEKDPFWFELEELKSVMDFKWFRRGGRRV